MCRLTKTGAAFGQIYMAEYGLGDKAYVGCRETTEQIEWKQLETSWKIVFVDPPKHYENMLKCVIFKRKCIEGIENVKK